MSLAAEYLMVKSLSYSSNLSHVRSKIGPSNCEVQHSNMWTVSVAHRALTFTEPRFISRYTTAGWLNHGLTHHGPLTGAGFKVTNPSFRYPDSQLSAVSLAGCSTLPLIESFGNTFADDQSLSPMHIAEARHLRTAMILCEVLFW